MQFAGALLVNSNLVLLQQTIPYLGGVQARQDNIQLHLGWAHLAFGRRGATRRGRLALDERWWVLQAPEADSQVVKAERAQIEQVLQLRAGRLLERPAMF